VYSILRQGNQDNLNVSAARLHVMGDLLGSIGALLAAAIILTTGWTPIDPILSVLVAVLILRSAWSLLRKSTSILMEETPDSVDPDALRQALLANVPGVRDVHDLHCWSLTSGQTMLTLHVGLDAGANGVEFDPRFFATWPESHRPHQVRLQGGDCSSDSYCYP
jgi:cobalt-zinc-cadmium efflux system protein